MRGLNIYMADGTMSGSIIMSSPTSIFNAVRVKKMDVPQYTNDLNYPGVYMLLIGNDTVYVGQSGLNTIGKRIFNTHSGNIDNSWHTVVGFGCKNQNISGNELLFIENALCEFAHATYAHCVTTTPSKNNCNATYRNQHYLLSSSQIHTCNSYFQDIKHYISSFGGSIFGPGTGNQIIGQKDTFYFKSPTRDSDGKAEILIHTGNTGSRTAVLKAGSRVSIDVSPNFGGANKVIQERANLTAQGKLIARVLQTDITFSSQSAAGSFLNGTSFDGNSNWKTANGVPLKNLLQ